MSNIASDIRGGKISRDFSNLGKNLSSALNSGISYLSNPFAGKGIEQTIQETVDAFGNRVDPNAVSPLSATDAVDAFGTPVSRAEQRREANLGFGLGSMMTDPSFMGRPIDTVTKTSLDKLVDRPSIAQLAEDRKKQNALNSIFDMLNKNTQNIEIAAGANTGKTLNTALPERRDLNAFTSPGFLQSNVNPVIKSEVNPRDPSNLSGTTIAMPDPPAKAPPGFVDIVVQEGKTDTFPGTNMSILGGKDSSAKAYSPLTEAEAMARTDAGISLERIDPSLFQRTLDPMDFTIGGSRVGNILPAANFRVKREPEVTKRVRISDLPRGIQEIVGLRSNLDYSSRDPVSMQDILDARRAVERGDFPEQEMADFLGGFGRYAK